MPANSKKELEYYENKYVKLRQNGIEVKVLSAIDAKKSPMMHEKGYDAIFVCKMCCSQNELVIPVDLNYVEFINIH